MPNLRNRCRVFLPWLFRATTILCWVLWISAAVRSTNLAEGRWSSHQYGINAAIAVCTWHSVNSGFFPPELLTRPCQEQVADGTQGQVAFQPHVTSAFVVIQPDLA